MSNGNDLDYISKIKDYLLSSRDFLEVPETHGRRFHYIKNGKKVGHIWFKWALDGWRFLLYKEPADQWKKRGPIESIEHLKQQLQ